MNRLSFAALALIGCSTDTFVGADSGGDAGSDGPSSGDGCATAAPCQSGQVCLNFDNSSYAPFFDASKPGGKVELSSDKSVTCPQSLLATAGPVATATTPTLAAIGMLIVTSNTKAHLEADVFLPTTTPGAASYLALDANADLGATVALGVTQNGDWILWVQASTDSKPLAPRVGAWNHITLDVTYSSSGGTGHASVAYTDHNGQPLVTEITNSTLPGGTNTVTEIIAGVGIEPSSLSSSSVSAYYDDVVFSVQ